MKFCASHVLLNMYRQGVCDAHASAAGLWLFTLALLHEHALWAPVKLCVKYLVLTKLCVHLRRGAGHLLLQPPRLVDA
jgi:hypothetical protein